MVPRPTHLPQGGAGLGVKPHLREHSPGRPGTFPPEPDS